MYEQYERSLKKKPKTHKNTPTGKDILNRRISGLVLATNDEIIEELVMRNNFRPNDQELI